MKRLFRAILCVSLLITAFAMPVQASATTFEQTVNSTGLTPAKTGDKELDTVVETVLAGIIKEDMTPYQKLAAIHNYTTVSFTYGGKPDRAKDPLNGKTFPKDDSSVDAIVYFGADGTVTFGENRASLITAVQVSHATQVLRYGAGVCDNYASAFVAMANAVGFEAIVGEGLCSGNGHAWGMIRFGEEWYIFDPQVEQGLLQQNGTMSYARFGLAYSGSQNYSLDPVSFEKNLKTRNDYLSK